MPAVLARILKWAGMGAVGLAALAGVAVATGLVHVSRPGQAEEAPALPPKDDLAVDLVEGMPHTLSVPEDVRKSLGIRRGRSDRIAVAQTPTRTRPLVLSGSTALDPARLMRIRVGFAPAEAIQIGTVEDYSSGQTVSRELRSGDHVRKGQPLCVLYSVDVGNKKNDLVDAILQLHLDEAILQRAEAGAASVPEVFLLNARRNVLGDQNAITRAVNTLKTWKIPEEDVQAVRDEAEQINQRHGRRDQDRESQWARVILKAPDDGVIVERNVSLHEMVIDNTTNLFQIARVDRLTVLANAPEDDLPDLQALAEQQRRWTVETVGSPPVEGLIDDIGYLIDPNQHTAVIKGHIDNPRGLLRAGQFVKATVNLPPPPDVVEIPWPAIVDDGKQCLVFVQPDEKKPYFTMRRVRVTHRFDQKAFVRSSPVPPEEQRTVGEDGQELLPIEPLRPGDRVLEAGVLELKNALLDRESQPGK